MRKPRDILKGVILIIISLSSVPSFGQSVAIYTITFESFWDTNHSNLPVTAHWSKLVGANHNGNITFLEMGQIASFGIERIAEEGVNTEFRDNDVQPGIDAGHTEQYIDGNGLGSAAGTITIMGLEISEIYPLLTLVSMIAPSPDWMIAVNGLDLRDNGSWKPSIVLDLYPYDAGTDSGTDYNSENSDTSPQDPISSLQNTPPFSNLKVGTLTITLDAILNINEDTLKEVKLYPNPSNGRVTISNNGNEMINSIGVYSTIGKMVRHYNVRSSGSLLRLNLENLAAGFYVLKMDSSKGKFKIQKLILK